MLCNGWQSRIVYCDIQEVLLGFKIWRAWGAIHLSSPSNEGAPYCRVLCVQNGQKLEIYIQSHIPILAIISLLMSSLLEIFKNDP